MLAVLAAVALLVALDRPQEAPVVEVSEGVARAAPKAAPALPAVPPAAMPADAPIPDLFAGAAAPAAADGAASPEPAHGTPEERPPKPFTLLGFRQEGPVREAFLLHGGEVATVRAGDLLGKRYRVLALGGDSVDIKDKQSGTAIRIGFEDHQ
jgi:hypothetical protein